MDAVAVGKLFVEIGSLHELDQVSGFGSGTGYTLKVGAEVARTSAEAAGSLYQLTRGDQNELLALSKVTSQMGAIALLTGDDETRNLKIDGQNQRIGFELARGGNGYELTIDYGAVVKGRGQGMDVEIADPENSRVDIQAKMTIPFDAFDGGNIDWTRVTFDRNEPPGFKLAFHPA